MRAGWSPGAAGDLVAFLVGLRPTKTSWTLPEIQQVVFLAELVRRGHIVG